MADSFSRYLLAKRSVDDRALNRLVYQELADHLPDRPLRIVEAGAGIGTMLARLLEWGLFRQAEYTAVDAMPENIACASEWLTNWAADHRLGVERSGKDRLRLVDGSRDVRVTLIADDIFAYIRSAPAPADLLIAHAILDLLPLPESLPGLFSLLEPGGLAWLTINFDGVSSFEPALNPQLDAEIERLYHRTMDERSSGGDSRTGRHLFGHLRAAGADLLAAGPSDWVVHPVAGGYPAEEAHFLGSILDFFEGSLAGHPDLPAPAFDRWLAERRAQVARAELVYIAHQLDFLVKV